MQHTGKRKAGFPPGFLPPPSAFLAAIVASQRLTRIRHCADDVTADCLECFDFSHLLRLSRPITEPDFIDIMNATQTPRRFILLYRFFYIDNSTVSAPVNRIDCNSLGSIFRRPVRLLFEFFIGFFLSFCFSFLAFLFVFFFFFFCPLKLSCTRVCAWPYLYLRCCPTRLHKA